MKSNYKITTYDMVIVGVMAALIFAATTFLKIGPIPTPSGPTMIKTANAICLLGGMLFGGVRGGLAAGIGSMFFDLTNPAFVSSAPFTLIFFFIMAFVSGVISHAGGRNGSSMMWNLTGAVAGSLSYFVLFVAKSIITLMLAGSNFTAALVSTAPKLITSLFNMPFSIIIAVLLAPVCRRALIRAGLQNKLFGTHAHHTT